MSDDRANATPDPSNPSLPTALLPLAVIALALTPMYGDRFGTAVSVALIVVSLLLVAAAAGLLARSVARSAAIREVQDVPDALDPLAGQRR
uniref:Uncharacterized protein n=1 Tax=Streptomyces sp. NBC_00049 TaxID=2903617 RepID=A0AAU2K053_9ACTN